MGNSTITLPDHVKQLAEARAAMGGFAGANEYVEALILSDAAEPIGARLEAHLLRAMESPGKQLTPADWDANRARLTSEGNRSSP
jgi:hypothetical protein